ncbi:MAG: M28 family peptidase [Ignavibacteria bacterium]|nr:M28 family peptidase [Ignavibacteria bacterium]
MKTKILLTYFLLILLSVTASSQSLYSPAIDSLKNQVSSQMIKKFNRDLSGDTTTTVGGNTVRIISRRTNSPFNPVAAQYIYEKFVSFGLSARYQVNSTTCVNVIATKTGTKYPNKQYIVCAHYDDYSSNSTDTIPGADDNASGICGVLESARMLSGFNSDYTIKFIAFDEEEDMMVGSYAYADSAYAHGDSIIGLICLDMIGYDANSTGKYYAVPNKLSLFLSSSLINSSFIYQIPTYPHESVSETAGSDNLPFQLKGYSSMLLIEWTFNPYYHSISDKFSKLNLSYLTDIIKATVVTLASLSTDRYVTIIHNPVLSSTDTSAKILTFKVNSPVRLGYGNNVPRVYYKVNYENYNYINAYYLSNDTLKFLIPGQSKGTSVRYYFALQDSAGSVSVSLPGGGEGINPPGTTPPPKYFSYEIFKDFDICSTTCPKPILDGQMTRDTIITNQSGYVEKMQVNLTIYHQNDGDLLIQLIKPGMEVLNLSQRNGEGGQNYFYTTFDDSASVPIKSGTPPFTGRFKPQSLLSGYNNQPIAGTWILRVVDLVNGNHGTLSYWCIIFRSKSLINIGETEVPVKFDLSQNYPNPFNSTTSIKYSVPKNSNVELKIYDLLGREVRTLVNEYQNAGNYVVMFNAGELASGVYFYKLSTDKFSETKKMLLTK